MIVVSRCPSAQVFTTKSVRLFIEDGLLFRMRFNQAPLRCIAGNEVTKVLKEIHSRDCDKYQGDRGYLRKSYTSVILVYYRSRCSIFRLKLPSMSAL